MREERANERASRSASMSAESEVSEVSVSTGSDWRIPRPSLSGSSGADPRSRGGSSSSQGSSSTHSTQSASSGSLLLSAAQLARVHGVPDTTNGGNPTTYAGNLTAYAGNLTTYVGNQHRKLQRTDATLTIPEEALDPFWSGVKRGSTDPDAASVASSTHFTVVNGFTRGRGKPERTPWCCNSSHQVTVLVITMTALFSAAILAAICFVEMRLHSESNHRFS